MHFLLLQEQVYYRLPERTEKFKSKDGRATNDIDNRFGLAYNVRII